MVGDQFMIGRCLWVRTEHGTMAPRHLIDKVGPSDLESLDAVFRSLMNHKKTSLVMDTILFVPWIEKARVKVELIESLDSRKESREMKADGRWYEFWNTFD